MTLSKHAITAVLFMSFGIAAQAADGRIPVYQPMTISQPGSYYLTRNVTGTVAGGRVIVIDADDVTLDLAGHTIYPASEGEGIYAEGKRNVRIGGGKIVGGSVGVSIMLAGGDGIIESLEVSGQSSPATGFVSGILVFAVTGSAPPPRAIVRNNKIAMMTNGNGIRVHGARGGRVEGNDVVTMGTTTAGHGISLSNSSGLTVAHNTVTGAPQFGIYGSGLRASSIRDNTIAECASGVYLTGSDDNSLDRNVCVANTQYGFYWTSSVRNVYSNNRLQGNSSSYYGTGNVSAGGNNAGGANF